MAEWADLFHLPEIERIRLMGHLAAHKCKSVSFIVENNEKADRYIELLKKEFAIDVVARGNGPVKGTVWVRIGPRVN